MLAYSAPTLVVDPTVATSNNAGTVYVVSRGQDGGAQMGFRTFDPNSGDTWSYLFNAGGNTGNRPAAGMAASGKLDVVVSGASKDLWYNSCQCCCLWSGWTMMTGATALDPGLINVP
jgi:hypothetical protein